MKLEVLGTGSAFIKEGMTTSLLLWPNDNEAILLDCGYPIFQKIMRRGLTEKVKNILLTHTHQDHCGSAITLLEYRYYIEKQTTGIGGVSWQKLLELCEATGYEQKIHDVETAIELETFEVPHAVGMECRALFLGNKVLYSGDCAISLLGRKEAELAKIIIHDASLTANPAHVFIKELAEAPDNIKAKTYLIHYLPEKFEEIEHLAKEYGFAGVAKAGDVFEV